MFLQITYRKNAHCIMGEKKEIQSNYLSKKHCLLNPTCSIHLDIRNPEENKLSNTPTLVKIKKKDVDKMVCIDTAS